MLREGLCVASRVFCFEYIAEVIGVKVGVEGRRIRVFKVIEVGVGVVEMVKQLFSICFCN